MVNLQTVSLQLQAKKIVTLCALLDWSDLGRIKWLASPESCTICKVTFGTLLSYYEL